MIHVIATITTRPGQRDAALTALKEIAPTVLKEAGCIEYGAAVDVPSGIPDQPAPRADSFTVLEKWESLEALHAHLAAPHMADYREKVKDIVAGVEIRTLESA